MSRYRANQVRSQESSSEGGAAVTPHDSNMLPLWSRALYVGGAGNLTVTMVDGNDLTFTAVPAGTLLPIAVQRVKSTGTSATAIVALF